jgi:apolipoprotein N-acyltransferase
VPWLLCLREASHGRAILLGLAFGCAVALPLGAWVPGVMMGGFKVPALGAYGLWIALSLSYVPALVAISWALSRLRFSSPLLAPLAGVVWALAELSHYRIWPGIPWLVIGATQIDTPLAQAGASVGVHGVSALVLATNGLIAQVIARTRVAPLLTGAIVVAGAATLGLIGGPTIEPSRILRVAVVQPAVPMPPRLDLVYQEKSLQALVALTRPLRDVDLVIWPESSLVSTFEGRLDLAALVAGLAREIGAPIVLGGTRVVDGGRRNSAFLVRPAGRREPIYDKLRLLPIAEYTPIWLTRSVRRWLGRFAPATPVAFGSPLPADLADIGQPETRICFEGALSDPSRDAQAGFILNLVNDGWFGGTPAAEHHLLLARWRAIESGAPLVRASTTGISAITSARGEILHHLTQASPAVLRGTVTISQTQTVFETWGYVPLGASAAVLAAAALTRRYFSSSGSWSKEPEITA